MGNTDKFEMIASSYDTPERINIAKVSSDAIREYLIDSKNKSAIDFGCGTGLVGMNLLDDFSTVTFLDTSQNMIHQLDQKISNLKLENAKTLLFDFEKEEQLDIRADYIFMAQVLLHIKDIELILSRLYQILNDEGHLIIVDFIENDKVISDIVHPGFDVSNLSDRMSAIGYKKIQCKTFYHGSKIFMGQDASLFVLDAKK
ncbi:class I SAM-dependent methyltransferase [Candidatus Galacturonibacter soehngenii]|uniref:Class I SAM-dependent methyltransferase n=1 Tax=Candidatus Galacturonatibacter soehngenii TaxID=2307010 RepID=A0A7V7QIE8_9FIRM|nr:class I SAM-dependent methyltransferase [Candidatus Galacturonibacter soehngenii]KAB1435975.1 class I SAM-dependent methyltransferase [Candidatus Galacturonibacter soehngenii]